MTLRIYYRLVLRGGEIENKLSTRSEGREVTFRIHYRLVQWGGAIQNTLLTRYEGGGIQNTLFGFLYFQV